MPPTVSRRLLLLMLIPCAALLVGCGGTVVCTHDAGNLETPIEAPSDGEYTLHQKFPPSTIKGPIPLRKGDAIGFKTAETGRINVVAGESIWTYEDASMVWKRKD
ncbi:hypothetical protein [Humisphaera borealis]|uniref:Uncharacterized protein n=1 Tax=Humisphaera borealis TaxID=2807512 RepID=A0A7M2X1U4_9BACT|nr:hypothetical protein [Humisphaera borealis]QOV90710.1 hypothetical protein IPV69_04950 [Humisphaera borealis]